MICGYLEIKQVNNKVFKIVFTLSYRSTQVRHWQRRALRYSSDWLAGLPGRPIGEALQRIQGGFWSLHPGQVRDGAVLHLQQPDQRGLRERVAQHQLGEDLLHLRHAHWL